jgi:hypothetical protein
MWVIKVMVLLLVSGAVYAGNDAGLVKNASGVATIMRGDQQLPAAAGVHVLVSDIVKTAANSSVGITLNDGTLLSAGPGSTIIINKFVFDSTGHTGELDVSLKRGTLAVVSGKLAKTSPKAVIYRTPTTLLGVRGTEFVLEAAGD